MDCDQLFNQRFREGQKQEKKWQKGSHYDSDVAEHSVTTWAGRSQHPELDVLARMQQDLTRQSLHPVLESRLVHQAEHDMWREFNRTDGNQVCHS